MGRKSPADGLTKTAEAVVPPSVFCALVCGAGRMELLVKPKVRLPEAEAICTAPVPTSTALVPPPRLTTMLLVSDQVRVLGGPS